MLASHVTALATARSCIAALSDNAGTSAGSLAYERVLLELDSQFGDDAPSIDGVLNRDRESTHQMATHALESLLDMGNDPLRIEIVLAMLKSAVRTDVNGCTARTPAGSAPTSRRC